MQHLQLHYARAPSSKHGRHRPPTPESLKKRIFTSIPAPPRDAAESADIERILGTDRLQPQKQIQLPTCHLPLKSQAATPGSNHPISHGWTRQ